jgi:magnesium-protoporphyrin O-methyltransferase
MDGTSLTTSYENRRGQLEEYFDCTAVENWKKLTSDAPLGRIRQSVRTGRDTMRDTLLSWLPDDLHGARLLDAGCGTGALSVAAAQRGADVVAIDLSPTLVDLARERLPAEIDGARIEFRSGDMLDRQLGRFDYVVAMDSLIHYRLEDTVDVIAQLADRTRAAFLFTFAPRTPLLALMHLSGQLFPRGNRSPDIQPIKPVRLAAALERRLGPSRWGINNTRRVDSSFYISQAMMLAKR